MGVGGIIIYLLLRVTDFRDIREYLFASEAGLRVNVRKNQGKLKKSGHGQKIDFAHTLSV